MGQSRVYSIHGVTYVDAVRYFRQLISVSPQLAKTQEKQVEERECERENGRVRGRGLSKTRQK